MPLRSQMGDSLGAAVHLQLTSTADLSFSHFTFSDPPFFPPHVLAAPRSMWGLSSLTRDLTRAPAVETRSPSLWATREVPENIFMLHLYLTI